MSDTHHLGASAANGAPDGIKASLLFRLLWETLGDVFGTPAAAVLLRRAAKRASQRAHELRELAIERADLGYGYSIPASWEESRGAPPPAMRELVRELRPILVELTGPVALQRIERVPELARLLAEYGGERS